MEINKDNKKNNINNKNKITDKNENIILDKMNENEDLIWTEKYRPKSVDEYLNISKYKSTINNWITPIINSEKVSNPFLILYGKPGTGKTTLANCIFNHYNFEIIECNASIARNKKDLSKIISTGKNSVLFDKNNKNRKIGIIMDELDGLATGEGTGITVLLEYTFIKYNKKKNICKNTKYDIRYPVICTSNSIKERKIKLLLDYGVLIHITPPNQDNIIKKCKEIFKYENFNIRNQNLRLLIKNCKSDYRTIINILYKYYLKLQLLNVKQLDNNKEFEIINNFIYDLHYDSDLLKIVGLPVYNIISFFIINKPKYLEFENNINKKINKNNKNNKNNRNNKINSYKLIQKLKNNYNNQLENIINTDNYIFFYNLYENIPRILTPLLNIIISQKLKIINGSINKSNKDKKITKNNKLNLNNKLIENNYNKTSKKIQYTYNDCLKLLNLIYNNFYYNELLYKKIKNNRYWELNKYINNVGIVSNINLLNKLNIKNDVLINNFDTIYHNKFNAMKQDLGFINNNLIFNNLNIECKCMSSDYKIVEKKTNKLDSILVNKSKPSTKNNINKNINQQQRKTINSKKLIINLDTVINRNGFGIQENMINQDYEIFMLCAKFNEHINYIETTNNTPNINYIKNNYFKKSFDEKNYISVDKKIKKINNNINSIL